MNQDCPKQTGVYSDPTYRKVETLAWEGCLLLFHSFFKSFLKVLIMVEHKILTIVKCTVH
jgi:hypothetical protein